MGVFTPYAAPGQHAWGALWWLAWLPVALALGCALFTIRGYTITPDAILVHPLLWATELPVVDLESARYVPNEIRPLVFTPDTQSYYGIDDCIGPLS